MGRSLSATPGGQRKLCGPAEAGSEGRETIEMAA